MRQDRPGFGRMIRRIATLTVAIVIVGCSSVPLPPFIKGGTTGESATKPAPEKPAPVGSARGINLVGSCKQTEVDGFAEDAQVKILDGEVQSLVWKIKIGRKGSCAFDGTAFRQTKTSPSIEMLARDGSGCRLLMWSDSRRITLAHNGCTKSCTAGVYDKAWPVMFDPRSGGCADAAR